MKKKIITTFFLIVSQLCFANMASPLREGTLASSFFSSRDINIKKEKIQINVAKDFKTAFYVVEYFIQTDIEGRQIPLLFHAKDFKGNFKIWVDNQEVKILDIPQEYTTTLNTPFQNFANSFSSPSQENEAAEVEMYWEKTTGTVYNLNDLKYFEADLAKGEHQIRIEYEAVAWTDVSAWVKEYSFRYSLSPAKHWKSFGSLEVKWNATATNALFTSNLGQPTSGKIDSIAVWNFSKLPPDEYLQMSYRPEISILAKILITISPVGLAMVITLPFVWLHFVSVRRYRKNNPHARYSWAVIIGSFVIPLLLLVSYTMSFELIDYAIGEQAGRYHGYHFLVVFLYPLLVAIYWGFMWWTDKIAGRT